MLSDYMVKNSDIFTCKNQILELGSGVGLTGKNNLILFIY